MKITEKSIDQPLISTLLSGLLFFFGLASYLTIPTEAVPEIKVPVAGVLTKYIGAGPEEIESEIIKPLEESLRELDNLDYTQSYALQGFAYTVVAFVPEADIESSLRDLREKVSDAQVNFIDEVENSEISQMNFDDIPILILNIFGNYPMYQITKISEDVMEEIETVSGVNEVSIFGNIEREIKISVDPNLLKLHNIPVQSIINSLQINNLNMPGGSVELNGQELLVRTVGKLNSIESIGNLTVFQFPDESIVRLKDVAIIKDTFEEQTS